MITYLQVNMQSGVVHLARLITEDGEQELPVQLNRLPEVLEYAAMHNFVLLPPLTLSGEVVFIKDDRNDRIIELLDQNNTLLTLIMLLETASQLSERQSPELELLNILSNQGRRSSPFGRSPFSMPDRGYPFHGIRIEDFSEIDQILRSMQQGSSRREEPENNWENTYHHGPHGFTPHHNIVMDSKDVGACGIDDFRNNDEILTGFQVWLQDDLTGEVRSLNLALRHALAELSANLDEQDQVYELGSQGGFVIETSNLRMTVLVYLPHSWDTDIPASLDGTHFILKVVPIASPTRSFTATYQRGDELFDESFTIDASDGDFLGETGISLRKLGGQMVGFEVWLFDRHDIKTVDVNLLLPPFFQNEANHEKLSSVSSGEVKVLDQDGRYQLASAHLNLAVHIKNLVFTSEEQDEVDQMTITLTVVPKEVN